MPWLRVDDTALVHPKVIRLRALERTSGAGHLTAEAVVGWVMLCATWSGQQLTDCWIPAGVGAMASPGWWPELADAALKVRMLKKARRDGQDGWLVCIDDGLFHLMSKDEVEKNRDKRRSTRQDGPKIDVLLRDGDQCRYCAQTVNPKDNRGKSGRGRDFDHPDPADRDTFVVACTKCNGEKHARTPEQAGMTLLPPPDPAKRHFHDSTLEWLSKRNVDPWRPGSQPDTAPERPGSQPDTAPSEREPARAAAAPQREPSPATAAPSTDRPTDHQDRPTDPPADVPPPGRDGSGRVGSPLHPGPAQARDGPGPRRGRRARRGRRNPQAP